MKGRLSIGMLALLVAVAIIAGASHAGILPIDGLNSVEASSQETTVANQTERTNQQVPSAAAVHGADKWHESGFTGTGVNIGIIERGFDGFSLGTGLPSSVSAFCAGAETINITDCANGNSAGAAVARAVFAIAPDASYYIGAARNEQDIQAITNWMIGKGVDVIVQGSLWNWNGPGNGTSPSSSGFSSLDSVDAAVTAGAIWINAAGDSATGTYSNNYFHDPNANGLYNFADDDECNAVELEEGDTFTAQIRWADTWGDLNHDLNVVLMDSQTNTPQVASAKGAANLPLETINFDTPAGGGSYCLRVERQNAPGKDTTNLQWFQIQSVGLHSLEHYTAFGSIGSPAESANPGMLAVGAAALNATEQICERSARGPTQDFIRTKPDIVGGVASCKAAAGQIWRGTGVAAGHVAGLAALVKQRFPDNTPADTAQYLKNNAAPRSSALPLPPSPPRPAGARTPDNNQLAAWTWGSGFAMLDAISADPCITPIGAGGTFNGTWSSACLSASRPGDDANNGDRSKEYYALFYTFTLGEDSDVSISLTSSTSTDTFLYLLEGAGKDGEIINRNDDVSSGGSNRNSGLDDISLDAGDYTIEATTYDPTTVGDFTLVVEIEATDDQTDPPSSDKKYIAISSGANHVCALGEDGSIWCVGDDSEGQVSERPTNGSFTEISSGDNHTCALRDDGVVVCWGSFNIP